MCHVLSSYLKTEFNVVFLRELGGALCPVLSSYLKTELNVVFVVDSANLGQVSQVGVLLTEILGKVIFKFSLLTS